MDETLRFGDFELCRRRRLLLRSGEVVALGARAFDLLAALGVRSDRVVPKHELLDIIWPGLVVEENNLQVQVSTLRKLLGPQAITTVPGRGYRFTAPLHNAGDGGPALTPPPIAAPLAGGLSIQQSPLIGREDELHQVTALLREHLFVTLVGAGGIGKTRLAQAVARQATEIGAPSACLVEMAPLADASLVDGAVLQALGLMPAAGRPVRAMLLDALCERRMLLVLDNCEHVIEAVAALVQALLDAAPGVCVLATSQEPLRLAREHLFRLEPLAVPSENDSNAVDDTARYGAVALFVLRARAADPRFALTAQNRTAVVEICRRLDGIALAIELAAARVPVLGVEGVRQRLGDMFKLLTTSTRNTLRRHQTLRAAMDWSHNLLTADEQSVFRRLSVFNGGFTLEAAQALASDSDATDGWAVIDHVAALVGKSLIVADAADTPRYRMLEPTRAYALERLERSGEMPSQLQRHAQVVLDLFERTVEQRFGEHGTLAGDSLLQRLVPELDNLRAAFYWALAEDSRAATAVALGAASFEVLRAALGLAPEIQDSLPKLKAKVDGRTPVVTAARFWHSLACLQFDRQISLDDALDACLLAEASYRSAGQRRGMYRAMVQRAWCLIGLGRTAEADALALEIERLEDPAWPGWVRALRANLDGERHLTAGRYAQYLSASVDWEALLPESGETYSRLVARTNQSSAHLLLHRFEDAAVLARTVVDDCKTNGFDGSLISYALIQLVGALAALGRIGEAQRALGDGVVYWRRDGKLWEASITSAKLLALLGRVADAIRLDGFRLAWCKEHGVVMQSFVETLRADLLAWCADQGVSTQDIARWTQEGCALDNAAVASIMQRAARGPAPASPATGAGSAQGGRD
jgi:predicted ATPase/DNA-binding winged helix-turn-helix (wHTH) protein